MNPYELRQKFYNLATSKTPWYKIVDQANGPTQIHIFNTIGGGSDSTSADSFISELNAINGPVELRINSEGGEVFQAKPIYNALSCLPDVAVVVDGIAASAASFIAMAASPGKLFMSAIGTMMIHDGMVMAAGSASDLRSLAEVLDKESNTIAGIYARRTGKEATYFRDKMRSETWYNAQEALEEGLCDGIVDARTGRIMNSIRNAASHPWIGTHDHMHEPVRGVHSHNHAAFGHNDGDDGIHNHAHHHDGDADHSHSHMSHSHDHQHDGEHGHAHDAGQESYGPHTHDHTHHSGAWDPDHDGDDDSSASGDTDHDYVMADGSPGPKARARASEIINKFGQSYLDRYPEAVFYDRTFTTEQRQKLAKSGEALPDGSYPIETCGDAKNARLAFGRETGDKGKLASHIRSREKALGGCGRDPFQPGDQSLVVIDENFVSSFVNQIISLRALRGA